MIGNFQYSCAEGAKRFERLVGNFLHYRFCLLFLGILAAMIKFGCLFNELLHREQEESS